jgi:hypothetical protein
MILRPFLSNQPFVLFLLIPVIALFHVLNGFFHYHTTFPVLDLGLFGNTNLFNEWWTGIPAAFIVGLNAIQLNALFNRHEFLDRNNYGPSLFYVVLMSFSFSFYQFDALLIVHACWLQVIRILFQMHPNQDNRKQAFNASFFAGLSAAFFPPSAALFVFLWLAIWSLKAFNFREWVVSLIGFAFPVVNGLMFWWFSGHTIGWNVLRNTNNNLRYESIIYYASSTAVLILFLLSLVGIRIRLLKSSIRFKKMNRSLIWILIGTLLFGAADLIFYQQLDWFNVLFIPLSFFFTFAFIHKFWQRIATWFFYLTFLVAVVKFFLISGIQL